VSWPGQKAVILWAAFSDAGFAATRAKRDGITGDGQEHFLNKCRDCPGLIFGPTGGVGELAHGIQAAFEGEALEVNVVGEGGLLHHRTDEVVGDEMHAQFAFDHVRRQAAQHIHVEVDFYLAEMEFDAPAPEVEIGEVRGGNGGIKERGDDRDALSAESRMGDGVADNSHEEALREESELFFRLGGSALRGAFPSHDHIEVFRFGKQGSESLADLFFRQAHEGIHAQSEQGGEGSEGTKPPIGDQQIATFQSTPELLEKLAFVRVPVAVSRLDKRSGEQAENAGKGHGRKAAARLLALALRPSGLVVRSVGHRDACAIHESDVASMPEFVLRDMTLHAVNKMGVDLVHHIEGNFRAGLAVGGGLWAHWGLLLAGEFSAREGHDLANRFAAGSVGRLNLVEKAPEHDIEGKDAPTAVVAEGRAREQCLGDVGAKSLAKLGKGAALGEIGKSLREGRNRRLAEKQGAESPEERC